MSKISWMPVIALLVIAASVVYAFVIERGQVGTLATAGVALAILSLRDR